MAKINVRTKISPHDERRWPNRSPKHVINDGSESTVLTEQKGTRRGTAAQVVAALTTTTGLLLTFTVAAQPASAAAYCQCVTFVQRYEHLSGNMANGTDMGRVLKRNGFRYVGQGIAPRPCDVAVWHTSYRSPYGHVAVVHSLLRGKRDLGVAFRGANQGGRFFSQSSCPDVSVVELQYQAAFYYRR
jgi:hypothetical protein